MKFEFITDATMKPYNRKSWWIDSDIIPTTCIEADSLHDALEQYRNYCNDTYNCTMSQNALKHRQPMYRDTKDGKTEQIGFVFTASTYMDGGNCIMKKQYIDLWTEIQVCNYPSEFNERGDLK